MSLIEIRELSVSFGARRVFSGVNLSVSRGDRIGIVGRNGEGKTTLLRAVSGEVEPDEGQIHIASGVRVGYLSQELPHFSSTLFEEAMAGRPDVLKLAEKMRELESRLSEGKEDLEDLITAYSKAQNRFEALGGYDLEHEVAAVLAGLGFPRELWDEPASKLSGGQKVRLTLAHLLVSKPDVLLLDEPTNHLDLAGVEWLELYLAKYPGSMLIISHDRRFLDNLATRILEVEDGRVTAYRGNYGAYLAQKAEALRRQEELYREQQELIKRTKAFIQKWKANANLVGQARSREKMLERLDLVDKPKTHRRLKVSLSTERSTGREVLQIQGLSKVFGDEGSQAHRVLFRDFTALIERGERVGLVGPNGSGKTTFLRCIQGVEPCCGRFKWGAGVTLGYFAQESSFASNDVTVLQEIKSMGIEQSQARDILGRFLFSGDDVQKRVGDLSGGEKKRLHLAKLVLSEANVLLLDEPTNHLDLPSRQALEEAIADFPGTVIFASHDRYLIDKLATRLFVFGNGKIVDFRGNYSLWKETEAAQTEKKNMEDRQGPANQGPKDATGKSGAQERAARFRGDGDGRTAVDTLALEREITELETEISTLESREKELVRILSDPRTYVSGGRQKHGKEARKRQNCTFDCDRSSETASLMTEWNQIKARLEELYARWDAVAAQIEVREPIQVFPSKNPSWKS